MTIDFFENISKPVSLHSREAEEGARLLMERMDSMDLVLEVLPNDSSLLDSVLEEKDFLSYCSFLESLSGSRVIEMLEELDRDAQELSEL